ncbi:MAG: DUF3754 domain-containing protein, partial [Rubripirellula sp.]
AVHWSIEPYIPLKSDTLLEYLLQRGELDQAQHGDMRQLAQRIDTIHHQVTGSYHHQFSQQYASLDPDSDCKQIRGQGAAVPVMVDPSERFDPEKDVVNGQPQATDSAEAENPQSATDSAGNGDRPHVPMAEGVQRLVELCDKIMDDAGYRRLERSDVEDCVGVASQWGVPLHVDLDLFANLVVYARGDILGTRFRRRLRNFYRREPIEIPVYQRMVVIFQLSKAVESEEQLTTSALHLRMFKNIPKQDIDTLLPGSRVRISGMDHAKIILPSLGGFLMSIRRIAQYALLFAVIALHWSAILVGLLIGYLVKSSLSYFQAKSKHQLKLTRNLYFQKLDTNAGVGHRSIQQAHRQATCEMILVCYAIATQEGPISTRRMRRKCERIAREAVDIEIDFQVDRAVERLHEMNIITGDGEQWQLVR